MYIFKDNFNSIILLLPDNKETQMHDSKNNE